jgi:PIN domain
MLSNTRAGKPTLYLETSVVSYFTAGMTRDVIALARQEITRDWWHRHLDEYEVFISASVLEEVARGDAIAAGKRLEALETFAVLHMSDTVKSVAAQYLKHGIIPEAATYDVFHLAFAAVHKLDILVTWNFKHLANLFVRSQLDKFNRRNGLYTPVICTPEELLGE